MNTKRVLITGAEGNIGSVLCPYLRSLNGGLKYHILKCDMLHKYDKDYIMADVANPMDLYRIADEYAPHIIVHMAAKVSRVDCEKSPHLAVDTNLGGLNNVIHLALKSCSKIIDPR